MVLVCTATLGATGIAASAASPGDDPSVAIQSTMRTGLDAGKYVRLSIPLSHPISVQSADNLVVGHKDAAILGFRYAQADVEGEVYLSAKHTLSEFLDNFERDYGANPQITGIVTVVPKADAAKPQSIGLLGRDVVVQAEGYAAYRPAAASRKGPLDEVIRTKTTASGALSTAAAVTPLANGGTDWPASYVDIYAMSEDSSSATIATWNVWAPGAGRSPQNIPDDWGMEFDSYTRDASNVGTRPLCAGTNSFWQDGDVLEWNFTYITGTRGATQPYFDDAIVSDSCAILDTTVGLGAPNQLASLSSGEVQIATYIRTPRGNGGSNPAGFYYQAVSHDCPGAAQSWCMGLDTARAFPLGQKSRPVFSYSTTPTRSFPGCYRWSLGIDPYSINCQTGE